MSSSSETRDLIVKMVSGLQLWEIQKLSLYFSILDQQQKQTIPFQGGVYLENFDGKVLIASTREIYSLVPVAWEKQVLILSLRILKLKFWLEAHKKDSNFSNTTIPKRICLNFIDGDLCTIICRYKLCWQTKEWLKPWIWPKMPTKVDLARIRLTRSVLVQYKLHGNSYTNQRQSNL